MQNTNAQVFFVSARDHKKNFSGIIRRQEYEFFFNFFFQFFSLAFSSRLGFGFV